MKDSKQSFKDLVKKMDSLEETQQGKLKGGFQQCPATLFGSHQIIIATITATEDVKLKD